MKMMDAVGTSAALSPKGDGGDVGGMDLGANAGTLALFASLFAMMQTPKADQDTAPNESVMEVGQTPMDPPFNRSDLPAAAMLMAAHGLGTGSFEENGDAVAPDMIEELTVDGDATALVRLLLTARDIAAPDEIGNAQLASPPEGAHVGHGRTATEMLTGAIEILKSMEATASGPDAAGVSADADANDDAGSVLHAAVLAPPSADFVGPMPAVDVSGAALAVAPPSADFVGPMPAVDVSGAALAVAPPSADFVGPMPAVDVSGAALAAAPPSADFVGPMPAVDVSGAALAVAPPSADFVGPMPAIVMSSPLTSRTGTPQTVTPQTVTPQTVTPQTVINMPAAASIDTGAPVPTSGSLPAGSAPKASGPARAVEPGWRQADGLPSLLQTDGDLPDSVGDEPVGEDMVVGKKGDGTGFRGGREMLADNAGGSRLKSMRTMQKAIDSPTSTPQTMTASLAQSMPQGAAQAASQMLATQMQQAAQGGASATTSGHSDGAGQSAAAPSTAGHSGSHSGGQSGGQSGSQSGSQQAMDAAAGRGTADRTMMHRLNTETAGWSEAMVKRLTADLRAGVRNVRMILHPQHLGRLNVELGLRNGQASIRIAAETVEAAQLLSGARPHLGQMLENAGMRLAGFQTSGAGGETSFDNGQGATGNSGQGSGKNAGGNEGLSNNMGPTGADRVEGDATPDEALRMGETAVLSILA